MFAQKGWERTFPISVIVAICARGRQLHPARPVTMGEIAEVNEHLFPCSGRSLGLRIGNISRRLSVPEIYRQHSELRNFDLVRSPANKIYEEVGDRIHLISTGE
ncbi:MAG: hypothetical protein ABSB00_03110 [Minisyncoccia bacterium]|jgi:hypothetical protein